MNKEINKNFNNRERFFFTIEITELKMNNAFVLLRILEQAFLDTVGKIVVPDF